MIAVLTGDIVSSRSLPEKKLWLNRLREIIEKKAGYHKTPRWGIFRGDGFQVEMLNPWDALRVAILIRSGLKALPELYEHGIDARIGIGVGEKGYVGKSINESDGEAYQLSGNALDLISSDQYRLQFASPWPEVNRSMNIALHLASAIIDDWSQPKAEITWLKMSEDKTQIDMARKLGITQPAVNKRTVGANLNEILDLVTYFDDFISSKVK